MWKVELDRLLPLLGHRNWILIVDKAYPLQGGGGISTLNTHRPIVEVLEYTLGKIAETKHLKPIVYRDREFDFMNDRLADGVSGLRQDFNRIMDADSQTIPHDEIFAKLDAAAKLFQIVVLKTESLIPYTSVFIELDCRYWNPDAEKELRERMKGV